MAEQRQAVAPTAGVGAPLDERWEYGYLYFVQTVAPAEGGRQPAAGPTVTVVADGAGHRCQVLTGRRLEVLNELGGQGWIVHSDGLWSPERARWLAELVDGVDGVERMVGYWQSFMRRRVAVGGDGHGESAGGG